MILITVNTIQKAPYCMLCSMVVVCSHDGFVPHVLFIEKGFDEMESNCCSIASSHEPIAKELLNHCSLTMAFGNQPLCLVLWKSASADLMQEDVN